MKNVHERRIEGPPAAVGVLMDSLASSDDLLWPWRRWPRMRLDRGLEVGSNGGHGPIRYAVARYEPGHLVAFAFAPDFGIVGEHRCEVLPHPDGGTLLRHVLEGRAEGWMRLGWPLCVRWLHDALIEDAFDRAESGISGEAWEPRPLSPPVRLLRRLLARRRPPSGRPATRAG